MAREEPVRVLIVEDNPRVREVIQRLLEKMGYVVAGVAHNLKNPLNLVIGFADLLMAEAGEQLNGEQREQLATLNIAGTLALCDRHDRRAAGTAVRSSSHQAQERAAWRRPAAWR